MIENRGLRAEVRRLHMQNSDLMKRVRFSDNNAHYMRNQVVLLCVTIINLHNVY